MSLFFWQLIPTLFLSFFTPSEAEPVHFGTPLGPTWTLNGCQNGPGAPPKSCTHRSSRCEELFWTPVRSKNRGARASYARSLLPRVDFACVFFPFILTRFTCDSVSFFHRFGNEFSVPLVHTFGLLCDILRH